MWQRHPNYKDVLSDAWASMDASNLKEAFGKLRECSEKLSTWNMYEFGNVQISIRNKKDKLARLLDDCARIDSRDNITACLDTIGDLEKSEEVIWKQRSRDCWVLEGDKNTRFFHGVASSRHQVITTHMVYDEDGNEIRDHKGISEVFISYFTGLFST